LNYRRCRAQSIRTLKINSLGCPTVSDSTLYQVHRSYYLTWNIEKNKRSNTILGCIPERERIRFGNAVKPAKSRKTKVGSYGSDALRHLESDFYPSSSTCYLNTMPLVRCPREFPFKKLNETKSTCILVFPIQPRGSYCVRRYLLHNSCRSTEDDLMLLAVNPLSD
jgi:hypothetical protein